MANFDSAGNKDFVMHAPAFATSTAADIGLISLDMLVGFAADAVLIGRTMPARSLWRMPKAVS